MDIQFLSFLNGYKQERGRERCYGEFKISKRMRI